MAIRGAPYQLPWLKRHASSTTQAAKPTNSPPSTRPQVHPAIIKLNNCQRRGGRREKNYHQPHRGNPVGFLSRNKGHTDADGRDGRTTDATPFISSCAAHSSSPTSSSAVARLPPIFHGKKEAAAAANCSFWSDPTIQRGDKSQSREMPASSRRRNHKVSEPRVRRAGTEVRTEAE